MAHEREAAILSRFYGRAAILIIVRVKINMVAVFLDIQTATETRKRHVSFK